jgi:hypothetical protein
MKICLRGLLMALSACAIAGSLVLAETGQETETVSGTVVSAGNLFLVIDADDGRRIALVLDSATALPTGPPSVGSSVVVRYRDLDSARSLALAVTGFEPVDIAPAPPLAAPSTVAGSDDPLAVFAGLEAPWVIVALAALAAACLLAATLRLSEATLRLSEMHEKEMPLRPGRRGPLGRGL